MAADEPDTEAPDEATPETDEVRSDPDEETSGTDEDTTPAAAAARPATGRGSAALRLGVCGVLAVLLLASLGYLGTRFLDSATGAPTVSKLGQVLVADDPGADLGSEREAAMAQANRFLVRVLTYGPEDLGEDGKTMPAYRERVQEVSSAKMRTQFLREGVPLAEATVAQQGAGRVGEVYATGVAAIDRDTATVLAVGQMEFSYPEKPGSEKRVVVDRQLFRYKVDLVRSEGEWLVDGWGPVVAQPTDSLLPDELTQGGGTGGAGGTGGTGE